MSNVHPVMQGILDSFTTPNGGSMQDPTESIRRAQVAAINQAPDERIELENEYGQVWDTKELAGDYEVMGFMAPYVVVKRRADGVKGSLMFQHSPRYYFCFKAD